MSEALKQLFDLWVFLKKEAIEKEDHELYTWFLQELQKDMGKIYAETSSKISETLLKFTYKELKNIKIENKIKNMPF